MQKITTFLMFEGQAEAAMNLYTSLFADGKIVSLVRHDGSGGGEEGKVLHAVFSLNGQTFMCIDSSIMHEFTFTPSMSLFVDCESEQEIDELYAKLSDGGQVLMALGPSPFSKKFGWVNDKFGVSWQLNLANNG
ncbi:VOC family protein [Paenibacillus thiaminolyticus]|uniref:VOC family protein n=1 Tax=Paenibacillus thiaminolyticus TaxID=49283 RepID=A0AAP9DR08_PANTH|nr:VOC family protein [Paenibacillus thiaminolyticus]MCY9537806.1 VOC family protein [Paenibacillus thiaminolyticus]MCY9605098.1 VOC family protein [Paenibacillus thiaminolyticus]MCY9607215.1 VOC family protein [Paenibacillus thiaminolyticus]MCY9616340.1 VOC family protein [Paenibacillus thiaminolyticus]MCY9620007.1 VOC family protein [Paenibacillus thiaminolyticus]